MKIPISDQVTLRPVYRRHLMRKHHMPLEPPTDREKRDAIRLLRDAWEDDVAVEALRILDEAGK